MDIKLLALGSMLAGSIIFIGIGMSLLIKNRNLKESGLETNGIFRFLGLI